MTKKSETTRSYLETQNAAADQLPDDAEFIATLTNSNMTRRLDAQYNLITRGHAAVPALLDALKDGNPHMRSKAAVRHILLGVCDDNGMAEITKPVLAAIHEIEVNEAVLVAAHVALSQLEDRQRSDI